MLNHGRSIVLQTISRHRMSLIWLCKELLIIIWLNAIKMDFKKGKLKSDSLASAVLPVIIIALTPWKDPQCSLTRIITILNQDFRWKRLSPIFAAIKPWGSSIYFKKLGNPSLYCRVYAVTCRDKSTLVKCILFFCLLTAVIFLLFFELPLSVCKSSAS